MRLACPESSSPTEIGFRPDPFNQVQLDAVFVDPTGGELRVPAFWDGGRTWKARYASPLIGLHHFHTECSPPDDRGLNGVTGGIGIGSTSLVVWSWMKTMGSTEFCGS